MANKQYTEEQKNNAIEAVKSGKTAKEAATLVKASAATVARWCNAAGVAVGTRKRAGGGGGPRRDYRGMLTRHLTEGLSRDELAAKVVDLTMQVDELRQQAGE